MLGIEEENIQLSQIADKIKKITLNNVGFRFSKLSFSPAFEHLSVFMDIYVGQTLELKTDLVKNHARFYKACVSRETPTFYEWEGRPFP